MTRTKIEIEEFDDYQSYTKYLIDEEQLVGNENINIMQVAKNTTYNTVYDFDGFEDFLTLKSDVLGYRNKIHIISLSPADKEFFESIELPRCMELTVDESVGLSKLPTINDEQYKIDDCPICLNPLYTHSERVVIGLSPEGCGHRFHQNCLNRHFATSNNRCPLCRRPIEGVEYVTHAYERPIMHNPLEYEPIAVQSAPVIPRNSGCGPLGCNISGGIKKRKTRKGRKTIRMNKKIRKNKSKRKNRI